jgi:hypothetical protein
VPGLNPARRVVRGFRPGRRRRGGRRPPGGALHGGDEVAQAVDLGDLRLVEADAELALDLQRQRDPLQGVDAEVELQAAVEVERLARVALLEQAPQPAHQRLAQQLAIRRRGFRRRAGLAAGARPPVELRQQEAAELAEPRARQRLAHDGVAGEALVARQFAAGGAEGDAQAVLDAQAAALADRLAVRAHQGVQRAVLLQHRDLGDEGAGAVDPFQCFREHILAAAEDDQLLAASLEVEVAVGVQAAEVAGAEPAVGGEGLAVGLRVVAVAVEDVGAAQLDLPDTGLAGRAGRAGFRLDDAQLAALERPALAADALAPGQVAGEGRGGLGEAVAVAHRPAEALEPPDQALLQRRAAGDQQPQLRPDAAEQRAEQQPPGAPAVAPPQRDGKVQQPREDERGKPPPRGDLRLHVGDQRGVEPRHADDAGGVPVAQRLGDLRAGQSLREDHRGAARQRHQQADDEGIDVVQRQRQQDAVVGPHQPLLHQARHVGVDVAAAEGEVLGGAGGPRGVDQHRRRLRRQGGQRLRLLGQQRPPGRRPRPFFAAFQQVQFEVGAAVDPAQQLDVLRRDEGAAAAAGAQQPRDLLGPGEVVAGHRQRAGGAERQAHRHPVGAAPAHEEHRLARRDAVPPQAGGEPRRPVGEFREAPALQRLAAHRDQRRMAGEARDPGDEALQRPVAPPRFRRPVGHAASSRRPLQVAVAPAV